MRASPTALRYAFLAAFLAGSSPNVIRLDPGLASSTTITGMPLASSSQRAISADTEGNTYLVGRSPDGSIQLRRLLAGASSIDGLAHSVL